MYAVFLIMGLFIVGAFTIAYITELNEENTKVISRSTSSSVYVQISAEEYQRVVKWAEYLALKEASQRGLTGAEKENLLKEKIREELSNYLRSRGIYSFEIQVLTEAKPEKRGDETYITYGRYTVVIRYNV